MPPPSFSKAESKKLMVRLRVLCRERKISHQKLAKVLSEEYLHPSDRVTPSTTNKWLFEKQIGICLNSETTLAVQKFLKDHEKSPVK